MSDHHKTAVALLLILVLGLFFSLPAQGQATKDLAPGAKVEVREGDTWSPATIVKREGRKYQIQFEGSETPEAEWVTADRLRPAGNAGATTKPAAETPAVTPKPAPAKIKWKVGDIVEVKWGGMWRKATVNRRQGEWTLAFYDNGNIGEWIEPWRIRDVGSDYDIDYSSPNSGVFKTRIEQPPRPTPGTPPAEKKPEEKKDPFAPLPFEQTVTPAVMEGTKEVLPVADGAWSVPVDATAKPAATVQPVSLAGPGKGSIENIIVRPTAAVLVYKANQSGSDVFGIERVDLKTSTGKGISELDRATYPVDLSPSGKLLLARANGFFGGTKHRIDLWNVEAKEPKHVISFLPYGEKEGHSRDISFAQFIDEDHAITVDGGGDLICWELSKAKALWRMGVGNRATMAASPNGKYLYIAAEDGLLAVEPLSGKVLGMLSGDGCTFNDISIAPDGKRLVGLNGSVLSSVDLEKGQLIDEVGLPTEVRAGSVLALEDGMVLLGDSYLFDTKSNAVVWQYESKGRAPMRAASGRVFYYFNGNNRSVLTSAKLPHDAAKQAASKVSGETLVLKPGDSISLSVEIDASDEERKAITQGITAQVEKGGLKIADGSPIRLVLRTEDGKTDQETYRRIGRGFGETETVNITTKITRIFYEKDGKTLWERRTENRVGGMVSAKEGQSINDAVQAASKFNTAFLKSVRVPTKVCATREPLVAGKSTLVLAGPKD